MAGFKINKTPEYERLKKEVSRLASMANKRLKRLELKGYTDTPSFQAWESDRGGVKFSVRGKSYNELQSEYWRVKKFLDARTSTIRGANNYLREIARGIGADQMDIKDLKNYSKNFFRLADRIKQYDKSLGNAARALDYQRIWQEINTLIEDDETAYKLALEANDSIDNLDELLERFISSFR